MKMLEKNFSSQRNKTSYSMKTCLVAQSLLREYKIRLFTSFTILVFKNPSQIVFLFIKKVFDVSGFPVITSSLRFTKRKQMSEKPRSHCLVSACLLHVKLKFGGLRRRTLPRTPHPRLPQQRPPQRFTCLRFSPSPSPPLFAPATQATTITRASVKQSRRLFLCD